MRQFALIDCRTLHIARYDGRKQSDELARLDMPISDMSKILASLDAFRRYGHKGLAESTQPEEPRRA